MSTSQKATIKQSQYKVGDLIVTDTNRVFILKAISTDATDTSKQAQSDRGEIFVYLDPVNNRVGKIACEEILRKVEDEVLVSDYKALVESRTRYEQNDSLRMENTLLHREMDQVKAKLEAAEAEAQAHKAAAIKAEAELAQQKKESSKPYQAKIIHDTHEAQLERYWAEGWTLYHTQFDAQGKLMTVWKKFNQPPEPDGSDTSDSAATASVPADFSAQAVPVIVAVDMPDEARIPQNRQSRIQIHLVQKPISQALATHGLEKTKEALDAMVTLAAHRAGQGTNPLAERDIQRFEPAALLTKGGGL